MRVIFCFLLSTVIAAFSLSAQNAPVRKVRRLGGMSMTLCGLYSPQLTVVPFSEGLVRATKAGINPTIVGKETISGSSRSP
jgi:hypothetical protein